MRGTSEDTFVRSVPGVAVRGMLALLAIAAIFFAPGNVEEVHAAGFFVTPLAVEAGQPFTFDIAMAGLESPEGGQVQGTEQALQISINVDRGSATPGNCVATRSFPAGAYDNWGKDWVVTGPDATWSYPFVNAECNGTNGLGPGDYVAELSFHRAKGDGTSDLLCTGVSGAKCSISPPHEAHITVLNPVKVTVTSDDFVVGGSVQINIEIAGSGEAGTWSASAESLSISGPCSGKVTFADGATSWGMDRTVTFPSPELLGNCGNIGKPGDYFIQVVYRYRFPSGGISTVKPLDASFKIRPVLFNVLPPLSASDKGVIALHDIIAAGQYGEKVTSVAVTCPDGSVDQIPAGGLETLNEDIGPSYPGAARQWPGAAFEGPCELFESGTYRVAVATIHGAYASEFQFTNGEDPTDTDGDGVTDVRDNCDEIPNPGQDDLDLDEKGDLCDGDEDGDGVSNSNDNCPAYIGPNGFASPDQADSDGDGMGDLCDLDDDNDGVPDSAPDNCRIIANTDQANADSDLLGDACDPDDDNDGLSDEEEGAAGTDPGAATPYSPGINPYSGGQPTGTSNPATAGDTVGVVIHPPAEVDAVGITVTDPEGKTAFEETLTPHSPVAFSFLADRPGRWTIFAELFSGGESVGTMDQTLEVADPSPPPVPPGPDTGSGPDPDDNCSIPNLHQPGSDRGGSGPCTFGVPVLDVVPPTATPVPPSTPAASPTPVQPRRLAPPRRCRLARATAGRSASAAARRSRWRSWESLALARPRAWGSLAGEGRAKPAPGNCPLWQQRGERDRLEALRCQGGEDTRQGLERVVATEVHEHDRAALHLCRYLRDDFVGGRPAVGFEIPVRGVHVPHDRPGIPGRGD